jgi:hypothetical protein
MKPERDIRQFFRKAAADTDAGMDEKVLAKVLAAHQTTSTARSTPYQSSTRSMIMRSPITRIAIAATIVVAVLIGISQFGGSSAGVAWGQVAQKVQASRGVIYRELRGQERPTTDKDRTVNYLTPTDYRSDGFREGVLWMTMWDDRAAAKRVVLLHAQKKYVLEDFTLTKESNRKHANYQDPAWWVQTFLACKYSKLEPKTIDGVLCEGIETTDLALLADPENNVKSLVARLWVGVETGYPVLFDGEFHGAQTSYTIFDQFQWDVALDPSVFEPNIPAGYEQM